MPCGAFLGLAGPGPGVPLKAASSGSASTWETSSYGQSAETTPMQLSALGEHLSQCSQPHDRLAALQMGAEVLRAFVLGRLVTTAAVVLAVLGGAWLIGS